MNDCPVCNEPLEDGTAMIVVPCAEHFGEAHIYHARCAAPELRREVQQQLSRIHAQWN